MSTATRVWLRRAIGVAAVASAVWSINLQLQSDPATPRAFEPAAVAPVVDPEPIEVVATFVHRPVYVMERQAAPQHRILRFDPLTGAMETVHSFTNEEQVNGLALDEAGSRLFVLYAADLAVRGMGLAVVDTRTGDFEVLQSAVEGVFLLDAFWDADEGRLYATQVVLDNGFPSWRVVEVDPTDGSVQVLVVDAQQPGRDERGLWFLRPNLDGNGIAIGRMDPDGTLVEIAEAQTPMTIDHLMVVPGQAPVRVAAHLQDGGGFAFGAPALAHAGPSSWFDVDPAGEAAAIGLPPDRVLDAIISADGAMVFVTRTGLWFSRGERVQVLQTGAISFVAG